MDVMFVQSTDFGEYQNMLDITSRTVRKYCTDNGFSYSLFLGLKRGSRPWHAALNRIHIIKSAMDAGYRGWIIYMDADAYIADLSFDLRRYLSGKENVAMIAAGSGVHPPKWWDINNGTFALNLGHPVGREIGQGWFDRLEAIPEDRLNEEAHWGQIADDQTLLQAQLQQMPHAEDCLFRDDGQDRVFNWNGRLVRQVVRANADFATRIRMLREAAEQALGAQETAAPVLDVRPKPDAHYADFVRAVYRVLLGREPDNGGFEYVLGSLRSGRTNFEMELRQCLRSEEFRSKLNGFLDNIIGSDHIRSVLQRDA